MSKVRHEGISGQMIMSNSGEAQGVIRSKVRARESEVKPKYQKQEQLTRGQSKIGERQQFGSGGVRGDSSEESRVHSRSAH